MNKDSLRQSAAKIWAFHRNTGRMPSYSEMLRMFGFKSKNAVYKRISALIKEGLVGKDRTGRLTRSTGFRPARLLGSVQAGFPNPAEEETVDLMSLDEYLISNPQATYLLKVDGDSMSGAGIMQGDLVLAQRDLTPRNGDIVIASVDGEWTLKYFERRNNKVALRAANPKYPTIFPREELVIAGVVIANVRKYR